MVSLLVIFCPLNLTCMWVNRVFQKCNHNHVILRLNGLQLLSSAVVFKEEMVCSYVDVNCFSSVQLLSRVQFFATPWTAALQASLSITNSQSLPKLMSIESVMPSNHLILCHPLLLPSIFPSIRVFSNESVLISASTTL